MKTACDYHGHDWAVPIIWTPIRRPMPAPSKMTAVSDKPVPIEAIGEQLCARCKKVVRYLDHETGKVLREEKL